MNTPETQAQAADELSALTPAERDVLVLLCKGLSSAEIAAVRKVAEKTVETQRHHIRTRLNMTLMEAAVLAAKAGWA